VNLLKLLGIVLRLNFETTAQIVGGHQADALRTNLQTMRAILQALADCNSEHQWLVDPVAARVLKTNPADRESVFRKEEIERLKQVNAERKEIKQIHRDATSAADGPTSTAQNYRRWFPSRGTRGFGYRGARGYGRGSARGFSPASAARFSPTGFGGQARSHNTGWRGSGFGSWNINSTRGRGNWNNNNNNNNKGRGGRGGRGGSQ
jgi:hypothetical protein